MKTVSVVDALRTDGYSIDEGIFAADECDQLIDRLCVEGMQRSKAGFRHLMSNRAVAAVASDRRLVRLAQRALGS
jgi:hypothetical protein